MCKDEIQNQYVCEFCGKEIPQGEEVRFDEWEGFDRETFLCPNCASDYTEKNLTQPISPDRKADRKDRR